MSARLRTASPSRSSAPFGAGRFSPPVRRTGRTLQPSRPARTCHPELGRSRRRPKRSRARRPEPLHVTRAPSRKEIPIRLRPFQVLLIFGAYWAPLPRGHPPPGHQGAGVGDGAPAGRAGRSAEKGREGVGGLDDNSRPVRCPVTPSRPRRLGVTEEGRSPTRCLAATRTYWPARARSGNPVCWRSGCAHRVGSRRSSRVPRLSRPPATGLGIRKRQRPPRTETHYPDFRLTHYPFDRDQGIHYPAMGDGGHDHA